MQLNQLRVYVTTSIVVIKTGLPLKSDRFFLDYYYYYYAYARVVILLYYFLLGNRVNLVIVFLENHKDDAHGHWVPINIILLLPMLYYIV